MGLTRKALAALAVTPLLLGGLGVMPAQAAKQGQGVVEYAVATGSLNLGNDVPIEEEVKNLKKLGVSDANIDTIKRGSGTISAPEVPQANSSSPRVATPFASTPSYLSTLITHYWQSYTGRVLNIRRGTEEKLRTKHNLTWRASVMATRYPKGGKAYPEGRDSWRYETLVEHRVCEGSLWWRKCRTVESLTVRAISNYEIMRHYDNKPKGIITTYCVGVVWCPDWVKNAVNG